MNRYMVMWLDILKNKQGDAPMFDFDTTIEAQAYIKGLIDGMVMLAKEKDKPKLMEELKQSFAIKTIDSDSKAIFQREVQ